MTNRPNLVLFMPDQLRADTVGCFGNPVVQTPNMDALAARGTRFTSAWSQHSVCGPSRVSMMTGWYPHVAGHRTLDHLLEIDEPNMLRLLKDSGYNVAMAGARGDVFAPGVTEASTDFCGYLTPPGKAEMAAMRASFAEDRSESLMWRAFYDGEPGIDPYVDLDEAAVLTALQWLREATDDGRPWALWVPLLYPHPPFVAPQPFFSMHDRADVPPPIPASAAVGKPTYVDGLREAHDWAGLTPDDYAEIIATYYGMISRVDDQLGRIMKTVEEIGAADDTGYVVFTDHGEYLGDYGLVEKWPSGLDPQLVANPLIMTMPGQAEGAVCGAHVEMIDLLPTLLELAETEAKHTHFGRSLVPLLGDASLSHRDAVFCEGGFRPSDVDLFEGALKGRYGPKTGLQRTNPEMVGLAQCVRTDRWSYVHRRFEGDELYDRIADPYETTNVLSPEAAPIVFATDGLSAEVAAAADELRARLLGWLSDTSDVIPWERHPRTPPIPHGYRVS